MTNSSLQLFFLFRWTCCVFNVVDSVDTHECVQRLQVVRTIVALYLGFTPRCLVVFITELVYPLLYILFCILTRICCNFHNGSLSCDPNFMNTKGIPFGQVILSNFPLGNTLLNTSLHQASVEGGKSCILSWCLVCK